jgi:hypothetical protein
MMPFSYQNPAQFLTQNHLALQDIGSEKCFKCEELAAVEIMNRCVLLSTFIPTVVVPVSGMYVVFGQKMIHVTCSEWYACYFWSKNDSCYIQE